MSYLVQTFHIIKDPVHGAMQFTDEENSWIKPFIDSHNFQRLRHIKQLGMADLVFPGAVHTRFNHALGCCYIAGQIATKLNLEKHEHKIVMLAALLHDVGHGPFSHAFEGIFKHHAIAHEDWTPLFLKDYLSEAFIKKFEEMNPGQTLHKEEFSLIKDLIMHRETPKKLLADIVSSQMDADRLDYLRRDSHFCGVTYGEYDFRWLLHCLTVIKTKEGVERLGITYKGIGVVEQYLMARRLMTRNVYFNGKKYAAEFLLTSFLKYLAKSIGQEKEFPEIHEKNLARFLLKVTDLNQQIAHKKFSKKLKTQFLMDNYPLYKKLCDYDVYSMIRYFAGLDKKHVIVDIAKRLYSRQLPRVLQVDEKLLPRVQTLVKKLKEEKTIQSWQCCLIDLPHQAYQGSQDPILVINKMKQIQNIHDNSLVLSGLSDKFENSRLLMIDREILSHPRLAGFLQALEG